MQITELLDVGRWALGVGRWALSLPAQPARRGGRMLSELSVERSAFSVVTPRLLVRSKTELAFPRGLKSHLTA
jgi:hypothetical protein